MTSTAQRWSHQRRKDPTVFIQELGEAKFIYVQYLDRGRLTHDEVLCRQCYDLLNGRGAFSESLLHEGQSIQIRPSTGTNCNACDDAGLVLPELQARR